VTGRIFLKLIVAVICLLLLAAISVDYFATEVTQTTYIQNLTEQLTEKGRMLALTLGDPAALTREQARALEQAAGGRITVIRKDGTVLVDSQADAPEIENHQTRPELTWAFRGGSAGIDVRRSATLGVQFLYVAVPVRDWAIRIAVPLSEIERETSQFRRKILVSTALAFVPALLIAAVVARALSRRFARITSHAAELARGNFRARLEGADSSEFGQLTRTLNETAENLQHTVEQLEREHAELEKVERVRKDFVINVSHELRTPLASIQGYTETLIDGAIDDPAHNMRFLGIIRHNAERLARLTEDLLTLSRIEQKRQKFEFDSHPVNMLLADAIDLMQPIAGKNDIRLILESAPDDAAAWCDSEAVSQILSNLLDNAIKYTHSGGSITVGARTIREFVEVAVRDTGIGIPPEDLPRLFERFYRVDKARSRELGGTGLGLSIVKHLVAAQNGTIRVESRVNQGSTFYFTLPLDRSTPGKDQLNPEFTAS
jgi:two-component system, OmpR family, phosphate regulon sensor histidine kinase PhoR